MTCPLTSAAVDGALWRSLPCPIPPGQRHKLQGVRLAGPQPLPPASLVIQRKVSSRGGIQHGELITTVPRAANGEITRFKAYGTRVPLAGGLDGL